MSLDTLLQAAEFVELSTGPNSKENPSKARENHSNSAFGDRRRVVSESEVGERRRRPGGAGTRETHNELEKNRRAHLKECFDVLKKQVPNLEEKKTSNLNILRSALKHIQTMKKQEEDNETEFDLLRMSKKTLEGRIKALRVKADNKVIFAVVQDGQVSQGSSSMQPAVSSSSSAENQSGESRKPPISVATQTSPNLEKVDPKYELPDSATEAKEAANKCCSTSSTDTGAEGEESDRKNSTCEDGDDEETDTDECLSNSGEENDIEIDVVGQDDSLQPESLCVGAENKIDKSSKINGKTQVGKRKAPETRSWNTSKYNSTRARKRSKSETKKEEDSDFDDNTKEEPKAKIQACARVSV